MLTDKLQYAKTYYNLSESIALALKYIMENDFENAEPGRYDIDGDNIYYFVNEYNTKEKSDAKLEAHKKYLDIHYIVKGSEIIAYAPLDEQEILIDYDEEKEIIFYKGDASFIELKAGMFAICYPQDLHAPGILVEKSEPVKKLVFKIRV